MAVPLIHPYVVRLTDCETTDGFAGIGGGAGQALETDFKYQGGNCVARKGGTSEGGFAYTHATARNMSVGQTYRTLMAKTICTTPGLLGTAPGSYSVRIGHDNNNYQRYDVHDGNTYPPTKSWVITPIDPNIAAHIAATIGTVDVTALEYFARSYIQTGTSKEVNQGIDAIDLGYGLAVRGGDGAGPVAKFQDLIDADEGTIANRWGFVSTNEGIIQLYGKIILGETAQPTVFTDSSKTLVFPDGLFAQNFSGLTLGCQNAGTIVTLSDLNMLGRGSPAGGVDTRPRLYAWDGTGQATLTRCSIDSFLDLFLAAAVTIDNCQVKASGTVYQNGATITDTTIDSATGDGIVIDDLSLVDGLAVTNATGYGIRLDTTETTINLTNIRVSGSGTADIRVNNASDVTINIGAGAEAGTAVNIGAGNVSIVNAKQLELTGIEPGSRVAIIRDSDKSILSETLSSGTTFTYGYEYSVDTPVTVRIISASEQVVELSLTLQNSDRSIPITQRTDRVYLNP